MLQLSFCAVVFYVTLCSLDSLCVVPCVLRTLKKKKNEKKVCCGFRGIETYFYSFNVRSQQILFFQHNAFLNDSSKNVYFNIYLLQDMYIFVIYN